MRKSNVRELYQLTRLYNVQTAYTDVFGHRRQPSPEALIRVLQALGAPVGGLHDLDDALRERRWALWQMCIDPVIVAWEGGPVRLELRLPVNWADRSLAFRLGLEDGRIKKWEYRLPRSLGTRATEVEGTRYVVKRLTLPGTLPWGYHRLTVETRGRVFSTMVISAPLKAYTGPEEEGKKAWGVFLPLYALRSERSWGSGDFTDLKTLTAWVEGLGGGVVGTLPLLAAFLDEPFEPSPYTPASRLFWNEFYLDVTRIPELERCPGAQSLLASSAFRNELGALQSASMVDYRRQMALKRKVMERLARAFFAGKWEGCSTFRHFVASQPALEDYARFRATCERQGSPWPAWPQRLRDGLVRPGDYDEQSMRYHLYVQWLAHEQLSDLAKEAKASGSRLYLDLPLGVHPSGYDVWRERHIFAPEVSAGAPPDSVFTQGQNWGFPPLHPEKIREQGYRHTIAVLRNHLAHAGLLRIDHVMGLHRLFWIPKGLGIQEGVYVRYPTRELYAILNLESHRYRALIVGENLGTVPAYVNSTMARHNLRRMYVVQYELKPDIRRALPVIARDSVASLNTHDMRPFASFWKGLDGQDQVRPALLDEAAAKIERRNRQALQHALANFLSRRGWLQNRPSDMQAVLGACLAFLSASPARVILINLEDLWLEREPQNIPGTRDENLNWQRKARYSFEVISQMPQVLDALREIDHLRTRGRR